MTLSADKKFFWIVFIFLLVILNVNAEIYTCETSEANCKGCNPNNFWFSNEAHFRQCCGNDADEDTSYYITNGYKPDSCPTISNPCPLVGGLPDCSKPNCAQCNDDVCNTGACNPSTHNCILNPKPICTPVEGTNNYCDGLGNSVDADTNQAVCNCEGIDKTTGAWIWDIPETPAYEGNHEDAGKAWGAALFKPGENNVNANCCGDDANEYYKPDYYSGACVDNVDKCVWSTGVIANSDSGDTQFWCHLHEWWECKTPEKISVKKGSACCAGTQTIFGWTTIPLSEHVYSCYDGIDNDCDTKIDFDDSDCQAKISGYVYYIVGNERDCPLPVKVTALGNLCPLNDATVKALGAENEYTTKTLNGYYEFPELHGAAIYDLYFSKFNFVSETKLNINTVFQQENQIEDVILTLESALCEEDCTYTHDNICHSDCNGKSGCIFGTKDVPAANAIGNCGEFKQPGFTFEYAGADGKKKEYTCCIGEDSSSERIQSTGVSSEKKNIVKTEKTVIYEGKPIKMVVVVAK